jgi:Uncharacterised protein family (UPF0158)/Plasmid pRiA4b ORF-3-like protein
LSITVELLGGRGSERWPYPGRILAVGPSHSFNDLTEAINAAFGRWDLSHLSAYTLADGRVVTDPETGDEIGSTGFGPVPRPALDLAATKVADVVRPGEQFKYVFDLGDDWTHRCTVGEELIDPREAYGIVPSAPVAYFGWGDIPDQYGRRWADDDGSDLAPARPQQRNPMLDFTWPDVEASHTPVSIRDLRGAAYRGDAAAVAETLEGRDPSAVLQHAGAAVLAVFDHDRERLANLAISLVNRLTERGYLGDEELSALLLGALRGEALPAPLLPVDLDELAEVLEGDPTFSTGGYLDLVTGEVIDAAITNPGMVGEDAIDVEAEPDRWLEVPNLGSRDGWRDMAAFADSVTDADLHDRLLRSIEGRGAFRRFRDVVAEENLVHAWIDFSADRRSGRAREYLVNEGIHVIGLASRD